MQNVLDEYATMIDTVYADVADLDKLIRFEFDQNSHQSSVATTSAVVLPSTST